MSNKKIAIIGLDSLQSHGLKSMAEEITICHIDVLQTLPTNIEYYNIYILSAEVFICNIETFLPKKNRILVAGDFNEAYNSNVHSISFISRTCNYDSSMEILNRLLLTSENALLPNTELSVREIEVLKEIASGKIIKEIADKLNISVNTVLTHRKNISSKLGIRSVSGLSLYAMMNGII